MIPASKLLADNVAMARMVYAATDKAVDAARIAHNKAERVLFEAEATLRRYEAENSK